MDAKILLQDLAQGVSNRTSVSKKDTDNFLRTVFDVIIQSLQEDKIVKIKGLGTFKVIEVSGRDSVNVNTGERIHISGHSKISFTPDSTLRDQVNRPFSDFETIIINEGIDVAELEKLPEEELEDADTEEQVSDVEDHSVDSKEVISSETREESPVLLTSETLPETVSEEEPSESLSVEHNEVEHPDESLVTVQLVESEAVEQPVEPEPESVEEILPVEQVSPSTSPVEEEHAVVSSVPVEENVSSDSVEEKVTSVPVEEKVSSSGITKDVTPSPHEKLVYVERQASLFSRVCFVLLTIALMALSYLAGAQHWFTSDKVDVTENSNEKVVEEKKVEKPQKPVVKDTISAVSAVEQNEKDSIRHTQKGQSNTISSPEQTKKESVSNKAEKPANNVYPDGKYEISGTRCVHVVKAGEGLYKLARIYYGNMNMANYIIKHNNIKNPDLISEGTKLNIPELTKK